MSLQINSIVSCITGWIPVKRNVKIAYDLESTPLQIKTNSAVKNSDYHTAHLYLLDSQGYDIGYVYFNFANPQKYQIYPCSNYRPAFPTAPPIEVNKVWKITQLTGPRITIHCNGVKVLDLTLNKDTCSGTRWITQWSKKVAKIKFYKDDRASDYYRPAQAGRYGVFPHD